MRRLLLVSIAFLFSSVVFAAENANDPNFYTGTDSERIAQALDAAADNGGIVRIPPRAADDVSDRNYWLLDEAILLRGNTTLLLENCTLKLSDLCRDNFIRSANSGVGIAKVEPIENVHIIGVGNVTLVGADHRATGDSARQLACARTEQTPARRGIATGDWRNTACCWQMFVISRLRIFPSLARTRGVCRSKSVRLDRFAIFASNRLNTGR